MNVDIRNKIKAKNINLDYVYRMTGVSKYTLAKWEKGKYDPRLSLISKLHEILGISMQELINL